MNWGHQHFQCCALPTELSRQKDRHNGRPFESGRRDSNSRPSPWQGDVLPLNYARKVFNCTALTVLEFTSLGRNSQILSSLFLTSNFLLIYLTQTFCFLQSGPGRIRTDDLLLAKQAPSRLATGPYLRCRNHLGADERIRTSTPCRAIDPKSIASAIPPRRPSAPPPSGPSAYTV